MENKYFLKIYKQIGDRNEMVNGVWVFLLAFYTFCRQLPQGRRRGLGILSIVDCRVVIVHCKDVKNAKGLFFSRDERFFCVSTLRLCGGLNCYEIFICHAGMPLLPLQASHDCYRNLLLIRIHGSFDPQ